MKAVKGMKSLCPEPSVQLEQYKDSGIKVIGYTCNYVPEELVISAGLQPYRITNIDGETSPLTPSFVCPLASTTLQKMLKFKDDFSGFILTHTCDPMWRIYDILKKKTAKPTFLLRVPHNTDNELAVNFFKMELMSSNKTSFRRESSISLLLMT